MGCSVLRRGAPPPTDDSPELKMPLSLMSLTLFSGGDNLGRFHVWRTIPECALIHRSVESRMKDVKLKYKPKLPQQHTFVDDYELPVDTSESGPAQ